MQGIERKVQQLTKVIYHLNAKGEEAGELGESSASYENEIEGILRDAGERVKRFQAAAQHATDEKLIAEKVREVELKYEAQKQRALKEIEEFKRRAKEAQVRTPSPGEERFACCACADGGAASTRPSHTPSHVHCASTTMERRQCQRRWIWRTDTP